MGYGCGDSFPFDFRFRILLGSKSKVKLTPQPYPIQFERKWKHSFLSVSYVIVCLREMTHFQGYFGKRSEMLFLSRRGILVEMCQFTRISMTSSNVSFSTGKIPSSYQTGKTTAMRRAAVRGNGVSRHHGTQLRVPLKTLGPSQHYSIGMFKRGLQLGPNYAERHQPLGQPMGFFFSLVSYYKILHFCSIFMTATRFMVIV